ncbi:MAG: ketopantoate reductase family protein, partial [Clostridiaceae bacterium]
MKIIIAGAGAMGCLFGDMLHNNGNEVLLIDNWKQHVNAINQNGLEIIDSKGSHTDFIKASLPSQSSGEFDLFIILTKAMQTSEMMNSCKHLISEKTYILTLQNGLGNIEILEQFVPKQKLIAGITTLGSSLLSPGKIESLGLGIVQIMHANGIHSPMLDNINKTFIESGLNSSIFPDVLSIIWNKVAINCVLNPICALTGKTLENVSIYPGIKELSNNIIDEIICVAKAENINLDAEKIKLMLINLFSPKNCGTHAPSMLQDIQNGRK